MFTDGARLFREATMRRAGSAIVLAAAAFAITLFAVDCARPAQSETLRVTYYYLPG